MWGYESRPSLPQALQEMCAPVLLGGLCGMVAVAPLSVAQFPYYRLYFFHMNLLLVAIGQRAAAHADLSYRIRRQLYQLD